MEHLSKSAFINHIQGLDKEQMLSRVIVAGNAHQRATGDHSNPDYTQFLGGVAFWLRHNIRPETLSPEDFLLIRPLAEALIERGQLNASSLDQFIDAEGEL